MLFWGCEGFGVFKHNHDGICARKVCSGTSCLYKCSDTWTHKECLTKDLVFDEYPYQWYTDITCEEFCAEESSHECEIDNDFN